ncbi:MAG: GNAT family N-acetyltransferase [Nocardioides marinisabuli]|uniref:GNAT family N-acetyltransferase n=1 Tax=Nocardioides marinisabuli TaxID=419476 RepID=UPI00321AFD8B
MSDLLLRPLGPDDEAQARAAHAELAADGFGFLLPEPGEQPWGEYVALLDAHRRGEDLEDWMVPATFLVAEVDGEIVGRASVRHGLNDFLATWGGHVGYGVRPAHRRRGYATAILRGCLEVCRGHGIEHALVTCDVDNVGSAAVIEACDGVPDGVAPATETVAAKKRYWVPTGL